jgi:hypothetical protein
MDYCAARDHGPALSKGGRSRNDVVACSAREVAIRGVGPAAFACRRRRLLGGSMNNRYRYLASVVATLLLVPFMVEVWSIYAKSEEFKPLRVAVLGMLLFLLEVSLVLIWRAGHNLRRALGAVTTGCSILALTLGVLIAAPGITVGGITDLYLGLTVALLGGIMFLAGAYLLYIDLRGADLAFVATDHSVPRSDETFTASGGERVKFFRFGSWKDVDQEIADLCRTKLTLNGPHFIAYYVKRTCRFSMDIFDETSLNIFFRDSERDERRSALERAGRQLIWVTEGLDKYLAQIEGGVLARTVLDVERGAMFGYYISKNAYLVGCTLEQHCVNEADDTMRGIADSIGVLPRGRPGRREL